MIPSHFLIFVASNGSSTFLASTEALEPVLHVAVLVGGLSYFLKKRGEHDSINDEEHPEVDFFLNISFGPKLIHNKHENCQHLQGKWMVLVPETWPSIPRPSEIPVVQGAIDQHREDQI